jgi:DNA-directed RNA polymerase specialized sigma subunit
MFDIRQKLIERLREKSARDFIVNQPPHLPNNTSSNRMTRAGAITKRTPLHPMLKYEHKKSTARLGSSNPKKNSLVIKDQDDPLWREMDAKNKDLPGTNYIKKMASTKAEEDLKLYKEWKSTNNPMVLEQLIKRFDNLIKVETMKYNTRGVNPIILESKAKDLVFEALSKYDPNSGVQLNTFITNNLKQLNRFVIQHQSSIRVPEDKIYAYQNFLDTKNTMESNLGREVTLTEVKEEMNSKGIKLKEFKPLVETFYSKGLDSNKAPVMQELTSDAIAVAAFFDSLDKTDQFIFKHTYKYKGAPEKSNMEIAQELGISPAAVSKRKAKMEERYRKISQPLSRFFGG